MSNELSNLVFSDEAKARKWLEGQSPARWPGLRTLRHGLNNATAIEKPDRAGISATTKVPLASFPSRSARCLSASHIPLTKWLMARVPDLRQQRRA